MFMFKSYVTNDTLVTRYFSSDSETSFTGVQLMNIFLIDRHFVLDKDSYHIA